ncbi:MAG: cupin domain-containing protein [Rhodospirillaceae bacterium]
MRIALTIAACLTLSLPALASDPPASILDPKALTFVLPADVKWTPAATAGLETAVLAGDPARPGSFYITLNRWKPGHFSRPHFHENDRFIYVISGTWWVGTGDVFDPDKATVPMRAGAFITHHAKQVHWDGAKAGEEAVIAIMGIGPAASRPSPTAKIPNGVK